MSIDKHYEEHFALGIKPGNDRGNPWATVPNGYLNRSVVNNGPGDSHSQLENALTFTGIAPDWKQDAVINQLRMHSSTDATAVANIWGVMESQFVFDPVSLTTTSGSDGANGGTAFTLAEARGSEVDMSVYSGTLTDMKAFDARFRVGTNEAFNGVITKFTAFHANGPVSQGNYGFLYNYTGFHSNNGDVAQPYLEDGGFWIGLQLDSVDTTNFQGTASQIGIWLNGTNNGGDIVFGTSKQAEITFNGTDIVFDAGAGTIRFGAASWTANGTATVSLTNLAPAGVTTSTVSTWLTVKGNGGVVYYIPAWT